MHYSIGGRGNQAPYETTHVRIPVPIKNLVVMLAKQYRETLSVPCVVLETSLAEEEEEDDDDYSRNDPSDLETIQAQAQIIQAYLSEINYLKYKLAASDVTPSFDEALAIAAQITRRKKSAPVSLVRLVHILYKVDLFDQEID